MIIYGHAESNAAWPALLAGSPVQVRRGSVRIGGRELSGDNLACLLVRPRPDSKQAAVAVVSGTGMTGLRLTERLAYFLSGVAYPDCSVFTARERESGDATLQAAGFFGIDWGVESGSSRTGIDEWFKGCARPASPGELSRFVWCHLRE